MIPPVNTEPVSSLSSRSLLSLSLLSLSLFFLPDVMSSITSGSLSTLVQVFFPQGMYKSIPKS